MAITGSNAYVQYGYESTYGGGATRTKLFGCEQKLTGLTYKNNQIPIKELYTTEIKAFAYGKVEGAATLEWILSNPWFFNFIFSTPETVTGTPNTHQWSSDPDWVGSGAYDNTGIRNYTTAQLEIGLDMSTNEVRNAKGVISPSFTMRTTVNDTVKISMPLIWSIEDALGTTLDSTVAADDIGFPYTFVHATLEIPNGTVIAELQDFEITFAPDGEQIWGIGSKNATATSGKKVINITGRFKNAKVNSAALALVVARLEVATLEITLTNGLTGANKKEILILGTGVGVSENTADIAPGEIIFENLIWQIKSVLITASNNIASPP